EATLVQGQRNQSLHGITNAIANYPDKDKLRNLAIAALALTDLREGPQWSGWPPGTTCLSLNVDFKLYARGDRQGLISVRSVGSNRELARLPSAGLTADLLEFSPNDRFLAARYRLGSKHEWVVWDWRAEASVLRRSEEINGRAIA